jgi:hypothetical protein
MATQKLQVGRAFSIPFFSDDVNIPFPQISASGIATGGSVTTLEDTGANFVQGGINPGDIIYNTTFTNADIVVGIISPTELELAGYGGVGFNLGDDYKIYAGNNHQGCVLYIGGSGDLEVQTVGGDIVTFYGVTAGQFIPVNVMKVRAATSAGDIIALW